MKPNLPVLGLLALFLSFPSLLYAQSKVTVPDTVKSRRVADSVFKSMGFIKTTDGKLKSLKSTPKSLLNNASGNLNTVTEKVNHLKSDLNKKTGSAGSRSVMFDVVAESDSRLNPFPAFGGLNNNSKFQNIYSLRGKVLAFGIPFMLDLSTDHSPVPQQFNHSSLFKFDFDPKQYNSLFRSDLENYYSLRRYAFNGLDLTAYTHNIVKEQLSAASAKKAAELQNTALKNYIDDPDKLNQLLTLNKEQITQKMRSELGNKAVQATVNKIAGDIMQPGDVGLKVKEATLSDLDSNQNLKRYLNDPGNVNQLKTLNEQQLASKLNEFRKNKQQITDFQLDAVLSPGLYGGYTDAFSKLISAQQLQAKHDVNEETVRRLFVSLRQTNKPQFLTIIRDQQKELADLKASRTLLPVDSGKIGDRQQELAGLKANRTLLPTDSGKMNPGTKIDPALAAGIDSVATSITSVTSTLQKRGYDVRKMLQIQSFLNDNNFDASSSEFINSTLTKRPANGFQSLFSHLDAFKAGSYGNIMPASTQNQEMFVNGTHFTIKANKTPLTFGYGSINDINSAKDIGFESSAYNQPRNITYIGAQLSKTFKVSAISSFNHQVRTDLYSIPTISANNVAFTLSKALKIPVVGNFGLDISKSTTLYNNKYQAGSEAVLEKLGGLNYNDMFATLSIGVNHSLDIKGLDASDNVYFNYSGIGYQNPGNNGFGGGRTKYGGNLRKSFIGHKLTFNLRSDITSMPISYTSNDEWKTHLVQLDTRYTISRKFNVSFKYTSNGTDKRVNNIGSAVYTMQKIQFDGNASYKIGKYFSASHFTVGQQNFSNPIAAVTSGKGSLLLVNYTQSVVMKGTSLTATVFYNKEMSAYKLIGNMLNSDITYQYTLFDKLNMASAVTYLNNDKLANQVGVRQGIQLYSASNFEVDSYVDMRKNLIKPLYPDLYASYRAELSLKYHLKN